MSSLAWGQLGYNSGHLEGQQQLWELSGEFVSDLMLTAVCPSM